MKASRRAVATCRVIVASIVLLTIFCSLLVGPFVSFAAAETFQAKVEKVVDGDTVRLSNGVLVRYLGINTPEVRKKIHGRWVYAPELFAEEAMQYNRDLVEGKTVRLEVDSKERTDRYGRLLAYLFVGEVFVNEKILERGLAKVMVIPPHTKYTGVLKKAAKEARRQRHGLWLKEGGKVYQGGLRHRQGR